jgi:hypothetical protein
MSLDVLLGAAMRVLSVQPGQYVQEEPEPGPSRATTQHQKAAARFLHVRRPLLDVQGGMQQVARWYVVLASHQAAICAYHVRTVTTTLTMIHAWNVQLVLA